MKIAVIGIGRVGGTVGRRWADVGHEVIFGVRNPSDEKVKKLLEAVGKKTRATTVAEAAAAAGVVLLAVPWNAVQDAIKAAGKLGGKVIIDCTNPMAPGSQGFSRTIGPDTSVAEMIAAWAKDAQVVKALNITGSGNMADPAYGSQQATMLYCGDDAESKKIAAKLVTELGFETIDTGPLYMARYLEQFALLWVNMALAQGLGPNIAFKLLKR